MHIYEGSSLIQSTHPHREIMRCACGATQTCYQITPTCDTCKASEKVVSGQNKIGAPFFSYDYDFDTHMGVPVFIHAECYVEYTNYCICPTSIIVDYPKFATYASSVISYAVAPPDGPSIYCNSDRMVYYYSYDGSIILSQAMRWDYKSDSFPVNTNMLYQMDTVPSHAVTGATFSMSGATQSYYVSVNTAFP